MKKTSTDKQISVVEIDLSGQSLGRVASQIAKTLRGKTKPTWQANQVPAILVRAKHASLLKLGDKKLNETIHTRYSGYPGGLKKSSSAEVVKKFGYGRLLHQAVYGMLPDNRLRAKLMKKLIISE